MCGLNLILSSDNVAAQRIGYMNEVIRHRGTMLPNVYASSHFMMGHVRLPIQGLSDQFIQPYHDHGWTFLFVGEITNWKRHDLYHPLMRSDVELVARAWAERGPACVRSFDGFWSIVAIPDAAPWECYIVTDYLCQKPLYVYSEDGEFAVSSEIRALDAAFPLGIDPTYFSSVEKFGFHTGNRTWARGVQKMPPGMLLTVDLSAKDHRRFSYSKIDTVEPLPMSDSLLKDAIWRSIEDRVMTSDVPIAMLVSGGLDSAIIYQVARRVRDDITIYHVENDEGEFLDALKPKHPVVKVEYGDFALENILRANEGPVDLGSMIPQYLMGGAVKERVCISGDGADELFGGYRRTMEYDSQGSDIWDELVHYHLPRLDKLMMAHTIELRTPFTGRDVLAGALALPYGMRQDKIWLREAFKKELPRKITQAPKRPLKSVMVRDDPVAWRRQLCGMFIEMLENRHKVRGDFE